MKRMNRLGGRLSGLPFVNEEPAFQCPLVEIIGNRRMLIENHCGLIHYSNSQITVKTMHGLLDVKGTCLYICKMTKFQMIIKGQIYHIAFDFDKKEV